MGYTRSVESFRSKNDSRGIPSLLNVIVDSESTEINSTPSITKLNSEIIKKDLEIINLNSINHQLMKAQENRLKLIQDYCTENLNLKSHIIKLNQEIEALRNSIQNLKNQLTYYKEMVKENSFNNNYVKILKNKNRLPSVTKKTKIEIEQTERINPSKTVKFAQENFKFSPINYETLSNKLPDPSPNRTKKSFIRKDLMVNNPIKKEESSPNRRASIFNVGKKRASLQQISNKPNTEFRHRRSIKNTDHYKKMALNFVSKILLT